MAVDLQYRALGGIVATIIIEHVARKNGMWIFQISFYMTLIVDFIRMLARGLGVVYAYIATFPEQIDLADVITTVEGMIQPVVDLCYVPSEWLNTVESTAARIASITSMRVGTVILLCIAFLIYQRYMNRITSMLVGTILALLVTIHLFTTIPSWYDNTKTIHDDVVYMLLILFPTAFTWFFSSIMPSAVVFVLVSIPIMFAVSMKKKPAEQDDSNAPSTPPQSTTPVQSPPLVRRRPPRNDTSNARRSAIPFNIDQ